MQPYPYGQSPFVRQPSELKMRFGSKTIAALVVSVLALVFVMVSMMSAWWSMRITLQITPYQLVEDAGYYLGGECASISGIPGFPTSGMCSGFGSMETPIADVFHVAFVLMLLGLILTILALVFLLVGVLRPSLGTAGALCAIIGSMLILIAPIYVFAAAPGAFNNVASGIGSLFPGMTVNWKVSGFFGSGPIELSYMGTTFTGQTTYGGGIGWLIAFVAFVLLLVAGVMILSAVRAVAPRGNYRTMPMIPYGYYQSPSASQGAAGSWPPLPGYPPQQPQMASPVQPYPYGQVTSATPPVQQPQPLQLPLTQPASALPLTQPTPTEPKPPSTCPSCGSPLSPDIVFCPACGTKAR